MGGDMDTLFLCVGCFIAGLGSGGLLGILVARMAEAEAHRPEVTPWGESTALWAEHDWDWWENIGRHSDPHWAARQRGGDALWVEQGDRVPHS